MISAEILVPFTPGPLQVGSEPVVLIVYSDPSKRHLDQLEVAIVNDSETQSISATLETGYRTGYFDEPVELDDVPPNAQRSFSVSPFFAWNSARLTVKVNQAGQTAGVYFQLMGHRK